MFMHYYFDKIRFLQNFQLLEESCSKLWSIIRHTTFSQNKMMRKHFKKRIAINI